MACRKACPHGVCRNQASDVFQPGKLKLVDTEPSDAEVIGPDCPSGHKARVAIWQVSKKSNVSLEKSPVSGLNETGDESVLFRIRQATLKHCCNWSSVIISSGNLGKAVLNFVTSKTTTAIFAPMQWALWSLRRLGPWPPQALCHASSWPGSLLRPRSPWF